MSIPRKFRKKPVVVEAMLYDGTPHTCVPLHEWLDLDHVPFERAMSCASGIFIDTLEGLMEVSVGDYVIRGIQGEFYPCKPDIFAATYEAV